jgi:hypothetical protein
MKVSEMRVSRKIVGHRRENVTGAGRNSLMKSFIICTLHRIVLGYNVKEGAMSGARNTHIGF